MEDTIPKVDVNATLSVLCMIPVVSTEHLQWRIKSSNTHTQTQTHTDTDTYTHTYPHMHTWMHTQTYNTYLTKTPTENYWTLIKNTQYTNNVHTNRNLLTTRTHTWMCTDNDHIRQWKLRWRSKLSSSYLQVDSLVVVVTALKQQP